MSASKSVLADTQGSNATISQTFRIHCNAPRNDTKTTVLTLIREAYRGYHVTEVDEKRVSLFEFAAHDKAQLIFDAEEATFNATRAWKAVGDGIEKKMHPGKLKDEFRFVRYVHNSLSLCCSTLCNQAH
jgi:transitional endoplasmic reticulum ATPase